ncbi:hypothetical protein L2E82_08138 [Cichorium intybus]|uniref:Uncharacterized protein n=1 Tax=Cichorium intybus TaxID=13427 RepID=A0ACB9G5S3_CICIN|nr:hypothetical protein L2E82_08138 [Cichorium intybus]
MNPSRRQQHHHVAAARASFQRSFLRSLKDAYSGGSEDRTIDAIIGLRLATAPFCVHCLVEIGIIFNHTTRNYDYVQLLGVRLKQFLNMSGEEEENAIEDRRRTGCLEGTSNGKDTQSRLYWKINYFIMRYMLFKWWVEHLGSNCTCSIGRLDMTMWILKAKCLFLKQMKMPQMQQSTSQQEDQPQQQVPIKNTVFLQSHDSPTSSGRLDHRTVFPHVLPVLLDYASISSYKSDIKVHPF